MKLIEKNTIQEAYRELIDDLKKEPIVAGTHEINNCCLVINEPSIENYWLPYRNTSEKYCNAELKWYWSGDNRCSTIGEYAKTWLRITDDGVTNNSAYGYILFKKYGFDQVQQVIELIKKDQTTRRAVLNIGDPAINRIETKDMQCTQYIQFLVRRGQLEETVYMRSNDVFFGLPYDYVFFISVGQYIAKQLGLKLGKYTHHATSMHMYLRDEEKFIEREPKCLNFDLDKIIKENYESK